MRFEEWLIRSPVPVAVLVTILSAAGADRDAPAVRGATGVVTIQELQPPAEAPLVIHELGEMQVVG